MPPPVQLPCNSHTKTPRGRPKRTKEEITQKIYIYIYTSNTKNRELEIVYSNSKNVVSIYTMQSMKQII